MAPMGKERLTPLGERKYRPKFTLDIPRIIQGIEKTRMDERTALIEVIGVDPHQASHAWYFRAYERMDVHRTMINDAVRTGSYLNAIARNKHILKDKVILDVGTGSGVLSLFAVKEAGMKQAIAVDASAIAVAAGRLVKECRLEERITVHRGRIEDMHELPGRIKEVDVIVSEWMGYALFNESVLDSIITARQRFLKDGGFMLPDGTRLRMLGSTCSRERPMDEHVITAENFFSKIGPVDLSFVPAADDCFAVNSLVQPNQILTNDAVLKVIDMYTVQHEDVPVDCNFSITCESHGVFRSFVLFFDVMFNLPNTWMFSTSPESSPTHWQQTVCCLPPNEEFEVWRGTVVSGRVRMHPIPELPRLWKVEINYTVTWKKKAPVTRRRTFYLM